MMRPRNDVCDSLQVLEPECCTWRDTGHIMAMVLGMVVELERQFILERQRTGVEGRRRQGPQAVCTGR
jgi:DNA invertase Pin-like site-specific DNA recombinase